MRLIDADEYLKSIRPKGIADELWTASEAYLSIMRMPTVDAVPVRRGKWMEIPEAEMFMCSECGEPGLSFDDVYVYDLKPANFCPSCGADMRKDGDHDRG